jgi:hypothetical protein
MDEELNPYVGRKYGLPSGSFIVITACRNHWNSSYLVEYIISTQSGKTAGPKDTPTRYRGLLSYNFLYPIHLYSSPELFSVECTPIKLKYLN